jgi:hypothetical protein
MEECKYTEDELRVINSRCENLNRYEDICKSDVYPIYNTEESISFNLTNNKLARRRLDKNFIARKYSCNAAINICDDEYWKNPKNIPENYYIDIITYFVNVTKSGLESELKENSKLTEFIKNEHILQNSIVIGIIDGQNIYRYRGEKIKKARKTEILRIFPECLEYKKGKLIINSIGTIDVPEFDESLIHQSDVIRIRFDSENSTDLNHLYHLDFGRLCKINKNNKIKLSDPDTETYKRVLS